MIVNTWEWKSVRLNSEYTDANKEADQVVGKVVGPPRELDPNMKKESLSHVLVYIVKSSPHPGLCWGASERPKLLKELM